MANDIRGLHGHMLGVGGGIAVGIFLLAVEVVAALPADLVRALDPVLPGGLDALTH